MKIAGGFSAESSENSRCKTVKTWRSGSASWAVSSLQNSPRLQTMARIDEVRLGLVATSRSAQVFGFRFVFVANKMKTDPDVDDDSFVFVDDESFVFGQENDGFLSEQTEIFKARKEKKGRPRIFFCPKMENFKCCIKMRDVNFLKCCTN